jgi:1-acyl-sn-glycerol-3-phosphate acyltransferase
MRFNPEVIRRAEKVKFFLKPIFELFVKISVSGLENIPENGPLLLISNHRSDMDPWCLSISCPRHVCWIADHYLFEIPLIGKFMQEIAAIPISGKKSDIIKAFRMSRDALLEKQIVGIFPEGHDTITNNLQHLDIGIFHSGFAEFALRLKADILPAVIIAKKEKFGPIPVPKSFRKMMHLPEDVVNTDKRLIYEKVHVHFGKPISIEKYLKTAEVPEQFESAMNELKDDMHELLLSMIWEQKR